jgi:hypothetical protein
VRELTVVPVAVALSGVVAKVGQALEAKLEVGVQQGVTIDAVSVTASWASDATPIDVATSCAPSAGGQSCTVTSRAPLTAAGAIGLEASATAAGQTSYDAAFVESK